MIIEILLTAGGLIWLSFLTFLFMRLSNHYNQIIKTSNANTLQESLDILLKDINKAKKDIEILHNKYVTIEKEQPLHIQKIGLLRFNPFEDTGGAQSFILALTDGKNTGVVISGLYSRNGTRWYAKKIVDGKGVEHELSIDEKKALESAIVMSK